MAEKNQKQKLFLSKNIPLWKKIAHISWPLILLGLINTSYFFLDTLLASILIDPEVQYNALAVLGVALPLVALGASFAIIVIIGTSLTISKKLGQGNLQEAEIVFAQGIILAFLYGSILFISLFFLAPLWMNLVNSNQNFNQEQLTGGIRYIRISGFALIFIIFRDVIVRTLRTEGRSLMSIIIPITALPFNLFLDWLLMGFWSLGLSGAAIASLISVFIGLIVAIFYGIYLKNNDDTRINFNLQNYKFNFSEIKEIYIFGFGPFLKRISGTIISIIGTIYVIRLAIPNGDVYSYWSDFLAVSIRMLAIVTVASGAFTQGALIVATYYYGKKDYSMTRKTINLTLYIVLTLSIIGAISLIILANPILNLFNINSSSHAYRNAFYILAASLPIISLSLVYLTYFTITKQVKLLMISNFLIPLLIDGSILTIFYFFVYKPTETSSLFFLAYPITAILQNIILFPFFWKNFQKLKLYNQ